MASVLTAFHSRSYAQIPLLLVVLVGLSRFVNRLYFGRLRAAGQTGTRKSTVVR